MAALEDDEYEIPLRDQRYFGAGIKRKRVQFVPSASTEARSTSLPAATPYSASSRYLDVVLKGSTPATTSEPPGRIVSEATDETISPSRHDEAEGGHAVTQDAGNLKTVCEICKRPVNDSKEASVHDSSITHQICLQHSHPPSHLDRRRKGLQVLSSHGWDPDSRRGLGAAGEGILHPIKATENPDKAGLGLKPEDLARKKIKEKPVKLDAGKIRAMESEKRKKGQKLRDAFYRSEDVEKYLGNGEPQSVGVDLKAFKQVRKNGLR